MALIPGSYARAAGLQSEINKVTITRVAGSEMQYRRAIDTYQRDLRFNVNQIGREQKLLRASMRRYHRKLRESRKERKLRESKEKEAEERQLKQAKDFREAERAVRRNVLTLDTGLKIEIPAVVVADEGTEGGEEHLESGINTGYSDPESELLHHDNTLPSPNNLPGSSDSGLGTELDDHCVESKQPTKNKAAYFQAQRSRREKTDKHHHHNRHHRENHHNINDNDHDDDHGVLDEDSAELHLPVINEEGENGSNEGSALNSTRFDKGIPLTHVLLGTSVEDSVKECAKAGLVGKDNKVLTKMLQVHALDTKSFSDLETHHEINAENSGDQGLLGNEASPDPDSRSHIEESRSVAEVRKAKEEAKAKEEMEEVDRMLANKLAQRKPRRKAGISYGDLIKLRHGTHKSTKQLFSMVDRLASKHGIADPPPVTSSSLDPRANGKIKQRGDESQVSSTMVRHAAVLYYMKYGHRPNDNDSEYLPDANGQADEVFPSHIPLPVDGTAAAAEEGPGGKKEEMVLLPGGQQVLIRRGRGDGKSEGSSHRMSLVPSYKDSINSAAHLLRLPVSSDAAASSVFDDIVGAAAAASAASAADSVDDSIRRSSEPSDTHRNRGRLTLAQLSDQATRIREKTLLISDTASSYRHPSVSPHRSVPRSIGSPTTTMTSVRKSRRHPRDLSPLSRSGRVRSLSRSRPGQSIDSQLQKRLREHRGSEPGGNWVNAFGRLKMIHTLCDLSHHFVD